jgi:hypothetical protein
MDDEAGSGTSCARSRSCSPAQRRWGRRRRPLSRPTTPTCRRPTRRLSSGASSSCSRNRGLSRIAGLQNELRKWTAGDMAVASHAGLRMTGSLRGSRTKGMRSVTSLRPHARLVNPHDRCHGWTFHRVTTSRHGAPVRMRERMPFTMVRLSCTGRLATPLRRQQIPQQTPFRTAPRHHHCLGIGCRAGSAVARGTSIFSSPFSFFA